MAASPKDTKLANARTGATASNGVGSAPAASTPIPPHTRMIVYMYMCDVCIYMNTHMHKYAWTLA